MLTRKALLFACLTLPLAGFDGAAHASATPYERIIQVPAGSMIVVLPAAAVSPPGINVAAINAPVEMAPMPIFPVDFPVLHLMAEQTAMVRSMIRQMQVLDRLTMPMPNPTQSIQSVMDSMPVQRLAPGTAVVTTMVSDGHGVCRQTITYRTTAHGVQVQPQIVQTGNDCGRLHTTGPIGVTQTLPAPQQAQPQTAPAIAPRQPPLWTVSYPAHHMATGVPRT